MLITIFPHDGMTGGVFHIEMWITFFGFVKMSGERWGGDNPLDPYSPTFYHH